MGEKRQTGLTMTPIQWAYVEAARQTGLYGDSTSSVLRSLITDALRRAVEGGIIAVQATKAERG